MRFAVRVPGAGLRRVTGPGSSRRGAVREFSRRSRRRLIEVATELGERYRAEAMLTLTLPGEWRSVCPSMRAVKRYMQAFRKRLTRFLAGEGCHEWGALWWVEFQARGAPHVHLVLWGERVRGVDLRRWRKWAGVAWSEVVGHADAGERAKHRRAGTEVGWMRQPHFGYATKYASKMRQKAVPDGFGGVGRLWGLWRHEAEAPITWHQDAPLLEVARVVGRLARLAPTERFGQRLVERFARAAFGSSTFAATVYGSAAVGGVLGASVLAASVAAPPEPRSGSG